jgi:hypothetical protein
VLVFGVIDLVLAALFVAAYRSTAPSPLQRRAGA